MQSLHLRFNILIATDDIVPVTNICYILLS
jgi:hypothetical protein